MEIIKEAFDAAVGVLEKCATSHGFHAAFPGYDAVWSRDSMITSMGASLLGKKFKGAFEYSLITLANNQSKNGQIPNAVDKFSKREKHVDFKSIDSTLWFLIGEHIYKKRYGAGLFNKHKKNIEKAANWLSFQDMGEDGLLEQLPTTDWQDAFPHRYGHTINTQALYYKVLEMIGKKREAEELRKKVNEDKDDRLWKGNFYLPWRWKNHNKYHERGEWFDSLGNLLAIIFELADGERGMKILNFIEKEKINLPYPIKAIYPPIKKGSKDWQDYFEDCEAGKMFHYLNGGVWTFIGGFYVLALIKLGRLRGAEKELERLAFANLQKPVFSEWLHGKTGKPGNSASGSEEGNQAWNAGMYILAYCSLKEGRCLI